MTKIAMTTQEKAAPKATTIARVTKIGKVIGLLKREHGATLDELVASTGWLASDRPARLRSMYSR